MMKIAYSRAAQKSLRRMPRNDARRILAAIVAYATDPKGQGHDVTNMRDREGYRMRIGDWRAIFDQDGATMTVKIVGPRGQVYKR